MDLRDAALRLADDRSPAAAAVGAATQDAGTFAVFSRLDSEDEPRREDVDVGDGRLRRTGSRQRLPGPTAVARPPELHGRELLRFEPRGGARGRVGAREANRRIRESHDLRALRRAERAP